MDKFIAAIVKNSPLALVVIGAALFVIGAAGGWPYPVLQVRELGWRIALAAMGGIVAALGGLLLWYGKGEPDVSSTSPTLAKKYGIKIIFPPDGERLDKDFELIGTYKEKPPDEGAALFSIGLDKHYYFKDYVKFETNTKRWSARVSFGETPGRRIILVVILGRAGQALVRYWHRVIRDHGSHSAIEALTPDILECDRVTIFWK